MMLFLCDIIFGLYFFMDHWLELLKISEISQEMILLYWYINKQHYWKVCSNPQNKDEEKRKQ